MLADLAREFADEELMPNAEEWDRNGVFPQEAINKARELGLLNCTIPEAYGGMGLSFLDEVIINEEVILNKEKPLVLYEDDAKLA